MATSVPQLLARQTLRDQLRDLARLRLYIEPHLDDGRRAAKGGSTFYAIDTNIIHLHLNPDQMGPALERGSYGYTTVFRDDPASLSSALALALSHHILFRVSGADAPCFLLPGHAEEVFSFYDALSDAAIKQLPLVESNQKLARLAFDRLAALNVDPQTEAFEGIAAEIADDLFRALYDSDNARQKFSRLADLVKQRRVQRIDAATTGIVRGRAGSEVSAAFETPRDGVLVGILLNQWSKRFSPRRKPLNVTNDREALARLELINRRLVPTGSRLVLITGDEAIHQATESYTPDFVDGNKTFYELYIRHPSAFLSAPEVLRADETAGTVVTWMDPIFSKFVDFDALRLDKLRRFFLEHVVPSDYDALSLATSIRDEWHKHTRQILTAHRSSSEQMREYIRVVCSSALSAEAKSMDDRLKEIDQVLSELSKQTWDEFFESVIAAGFEFFETGAERIRRTRLSPPVKLNKLPVTQAFVDGVTRRSLRDYAGTREDLESLLSKIREEDGRHGYGITLAFAMLYADRECWSQAKSLTERALALTELRPSDIFSGREAHFLLAVAQRMLARSDQDFDDARRSLQMARAKADIDLVKMPGFSTYSYRFELEDLAVDLSQLLHRVHVESSRGAAERKSGYGIQAGLIKFCKEQDRDQPMWLEFGIDRMALTKLFLNCAILEFIGESEAPILEFDLREYANQFDALVQSAEQSGEDALGRPLSQIVVVVNDYASARFRPLESKARKQIQVRVNATRSRLTKHSRDYLFRNFARPYDPQEYNMLLDLTEKHLR